MPTSLPCPFCANPSVRLTAAGEFRVHGPRDNRCEGSGTTPVNGVHPEPQVQSEQLVLGTLASIAEHSPGVRKVTETLTKAIEQGFNVTPVTLPDKSIGSDVPAHIEGSNGDLQPPTVSEFLTEYRDQQLNDQLRQSLSDLAVDQLCECVGEKIATNCPVHGTRPWALCNDCNYDTHRCPGCGEPLAHGVEVCDACALEHAAGVPGTTVLVDGPIPLSVRPAPTPGEVIAVDSSGIEWVGPLSTVHGIIGPVLAPPTQEITAQRVAQAQEQAAKVQAAVRARRQPAKPAWTGTQRLDSLGADAVLGKQEAIKAAIELVKLQVPLACDIESEGLGLAARAIKVVTFSDGQTVTLLDPREPDQAKVITWVFDNAPELIYHNAPFDVPQLAINGLFKREHAAKVTDTLIYARGAEPANTVSKSLGECCKRYLHLVYDKYGMRAAGKAAGLNSDEAVYREMDLDRPIYARGAATDAVVTARLVSLVRKAFLTRLTTGHPFADWGVTGSEAEDLVEREQKLNRMSLRRAVTGLRVDLDYLDEFNAEQGAKIHKVEQKLREYGIRPTVAPDLLTWMDDHNFVPEGYPRTPKTQALSGSKEHLPMLGHPLAQIFLWHKEQTHILHHYLEKVRDNAVSRDGHLWIHPSINYFGAVTGRASISGDPLHQFPGDARGVILADPGALFTSIDWSQIEPVVIANVAGETDILYSYEHEGKKFYTVVEEFTGIDYKKAKAQLLGTLYGKGKALTAANLGFTGPDALDRAEEVKNAIFAPMPKILQMTYTLRDIARQYQMVPTISGRILPIGMSMYNGEPSVATHKGVNYHVQGSAYDVLAESMLEVEKQGLGDAIYLHMHDELVTDSEAAHDIQKIMEQPPARLIQHSGRTPILRTDLEPLGPRWAAA